jgi:hypothetical protein
MGPNTPLAIVKTNWWTNTEIKITVPQVLGGQILDVEITHLDGTKSNRIGFSVSTGQPIIHDISPANSQPLQQISLSGSGFGEREGSVEIFFRENTNYSKPNSICEIKSWSNSKVVCILPGNVNNGVEYAFRVKIPDDISSSIVYYKVGH